MNNRCELGLGTVQWGLPYGIANTQGVTPSETVADILMEAQKSGIKILDTASQYGEAENILGSNPLEEFRVVSKTPSFATSTISEQQAHQLIQVFYRSLQRLSCNKIYALLVHHAEDLLIPGGEKLVAAMKQLKQEGLVEKIGVSIYDGAQVDSIVKILQPDVVQLPLSVLDQRLISSGHLKRMNENGIEIHVRSIFLQGLLLMPLNQVPAYFDPMRTLLARWHKAAKRQGMSLTQAALTFVRDIPHVDTVLIGVENLAQLRSNLEDFAIEASFDGADLACNDPIYVNPALWKF